MGSAKNDVCVAAEPIVQAIRPQEKIKMNENCRKDV
jgi:hypothetical protein